MVVLAALPAAAAVLPACGATTAGLPPTDAGALGSVLLDAGAGAPCVGCVVDRTWLVWIDPSARKPLWRYEPDSEIVGQPNLVDGRVVVADQAGRYTALDRGTGEKAGKGHQLRGSVAAVASPVELLEGRALAPLSDGTMLLLDLREPAKAKEKGKAKDKEP